MNYQNRLSGFQSSVAENQGNFDNYLAKKKGVAEANKSYINDAKNLAQAHLTAESLKGIGMEGAIRILKPQAGKILSWADKKVLGGRVGKDTEAFKGRVQKGLSNIKDKLTSKAKAKLGIEDKDGNDVGDSASGEGSEMTGDTIDDVRGTAPSSEISSSSKNNFMASETEPEFTEGMTTSQSGGLDMADREYDLFGQTDHPNHWSNTGEENPNARSDFVDETNETSAGSKESYEGEETKEPDDVGDNPMDRDVPDSEVRAQGNMGDANPANDAEDVGKGAEGLAEGAGEEGADEGIGAGLEGAGTALDATGYGAIVGIPLQIAGAVLEAGGLYEAGKSVVDWFEQDILGEKPKINPQHIANPIKPSTLAGQGLQATPTFDTTMDVAGGVGGW